MALRFVFANITKKMVSGSDKAISEKAASLIFIFAAIFVLHSGYKMYQLHRECLKTENENSILYSKKETFSRRSSANNFQNHSTFFNTEFYQNSINAYFKINNIQGVTIVPMAGNHTNTMQLKIVFPLIDANRLREVIIAFSQLGYISDANETEMILHVIPFTRDDAIMTINTIDNKGERR